MCTSACVCVCWFLSQWEMSDVAVNTRFHGRGKVKASPRIHGKAHEHAGPHQPRWNTSFFSFKKKIPVNGSCLCSHNSLERLVFIGWAACNNTGRINVLMHSSLVSDKLWLSGRRDICRPTFLFSPQGSGQS